MLKKLRWRFILISMTSITVVLLVLLALINIVNFSVTTNELDGAIRMLSEQVTNLIPNDKPDQIPPQKAAGRSPTPKQQYSITFFSVYCNKNGDILDIRNNVYFSVSDEEASELVETVIKKNKSEGYCNHYRFNAEMLPFGYRISFLGCSIELQNFWNFFYVSCIVSLISLMAVFLLVWANSRRAIEPFARNLERQKEFITDASHELKTPLTSIATSVDVLAMEQKDNEWISNIKKQTVHLCKLVGNLVTLSRLDEENPFPETAEFSVSDAIWEISEPFASLAKAKGKCYNQHIADDLHLLGDKAAVQQMVSILLDNAIKHSDDEGNIRMNVYQRNRNIIIQIFNTCDYVDSQNISKLFDRFYRADKSRNKNTGGFGIGLAIAKATAEAHNGKITVSSQDEKSICFTVIL